METNTNTTSNQTTQTANAQGKDLAGVFLDMMLDGREDVLDARYAEEVYSGSWDRALAAYVAAHQASILHHYATKYPTLTPPTVKVAPSRRGQRFIRLWEEHDGRDNAGHASRSCIGFIEPATGYLWKCATWKAPATNFPRASMYDRPKFTGGIYCYNTPYTGAPVAPGITR